MGEIIAKSKKINCDKKIKTGWLLMAVLLAATVLFSVLDYSEYKEIQKAGVDYKVRTDSSFRGGSYKETVEDIYFWLDFYYPVYGDSLFAESDRLYNQAKRYDEMAIASELKQLGYDLEGHIARYFFKYTNFFSYMLHSSAFVLSVSVIVVFILIVVLYNRNKKMQMTIYDDRIVCEKGKKTIKEFFIKDVKSVEFCSNKGLKLRGNSVKYKINRLENREELKNAIMSRLSKISAESDTIRTKDMSADSIVKYKELLDAGVISLEEFEHKKKEILGL